MARRSELMIQPTRRSIPEGHPIRNLFHTLTVRGFEQTRLRDDETIHYVVDLLTNFVDVKNLRRVKDDSGRELDNIFEIVRRAGDAMSAEERQAFYQHIGDLTLFNLGLYPESLTYGRHTVSPDF